MTLPASRLVRATRLDWAAPGGGFILVASRAHLDSTVVVSLGDIDRGARVEGLAVIAGVTVGRIHASGEGASLPMMIAGETAWQPVGIRYRDMAPGRGRDLADCF